MRFHDLRHCAATLLLANGVTLRKILEILGHSQISLTANIYAHIAPELKHRTADKVFVLVTGCVAKLPMFRTPSMLSPIARRRVCSAGWYVCPPTRTARELWDYLVLGFAANVPTERMNDVLLIDPADREFLPAFSPLAGAPIRRRHDAQV